MANPNIKIKRSAVPGKRPTTDQLPLGELGLNTYDGQLFAQVDTGGVGIATTVASLTPWKENYGGNSISYANNVSIGSTLTVQNFVVNGTVSAASSTGQNGQYLQSTGVGVTWASFPTLRTTSTFSATSSQTSFSVNYNVGFIDVYINGVRLTDSDYTASNGTSVILNESCYGGEVVDIIAYNTTSTSGSGGGSGSGISTEYQTLNDVLGLGNTSTRGMSVGVITATTINPTDSRLNSTSEKSTVISGNTVSLVYNTGGGNVAICTNPTGAITLNVTGIPTDSSFDNRTINFTVVAIQTATGYACTTINLNGVSKTVKYPGGVVSVASTSSYDIFNFTGINTVGSGSTTANYQILGMLNGNFK